MGRQQPPPQPDPFLGRGYKAAVMLPEFRVAGHVLRRQWDFGRKKELVLS